MNTHNFLFLLLTVIVLAGVSAVAGLIGYQVAREGGARPTDAIGRAGIVFLSVMTLFTALLSVLVTAHT
ncbi:hypothetical protein AB0932_30135 [Streptomyces sp. NPDC006682]|uniref:hypothetical protein n=1 Tax=unclassified Streptomyces TaxID=2593676 RepID=UPI0034536AD1